MVHRGAFQALPNMVAMQEGCDDAQNFAAEPIDYAEEARMLIDAIDSLEHAPIDLSFSS